MENALKEFKKHLKILHDIGGEKPDILEIVQASKPQYKYKIEKWLNRDDMGSDALLKDILERQENVTFFRLYYYEGFTYREIGEMTGYSFQTVANRLKNVTKQILELD